MADEVMKERQCAEMRECLKLIVPAVPKGWKADDFLTEIFEAAKHALSSECGRDFVNVREFDPVIEFLENLLEVTGEFLDDETGHYTKLTEDLLLKVKLLRKGQQ